MWCQVYIYMHIWPKKKRKVYICIRKRLLCHVYMIYVVEPTCLCTDTMHTIVDLSSWEDVCLTLPYMEVARA